MKLVKFFFVFLFFLSFKINANHLIDHLNKFFQEEYSLNKNSFKVIILTPLIKKQICQKPYFLLSNNCHNFGACDVLYVCGKTRQFLKLELQVTGKYIIAKKRIFRGTKISESDVKVIIGRLDKLPKGIYLNKEDVINRVNLRDILPLQPITSYMTRIFWIVKSNQEVTVKFKGNNFEIITVGKALSNGGIKEKINVKIKHGKIITGIINQHGEVIVVL